MHTHMHAHPHACTQISIVWVLHLLKPMYPSFISSELDHRVTEVSQFQKDYSLILWFIRLRKTGCRIYSNKYDIFKGRTLYCSNCLKFIMFDISLSVNFWKEWIILVIISRALIDWILYENYIDYVSFGLIFFFWYELFIYFIGNRFFSYKIIWLWFSFFLIISVPPHLLFHPDPHPFCLLRKQTSIQGIIIK